MDNQVEHEQRTEVDANMHLVFLFYFFQYFFHLVQEVFSFFSPIHCPNV